MDEHQRDVGVERQEPEAADASESAAPGTDTEDGAADRTWGPDDTVGDARSPAT